MRRAGLVLLASLAMSAVVVGGCGGSDEPQTDEAAAAPTTPPELISKLSTAAHAGDVDAVMSHLTPEAAAQNGQTWIGFLGRTASQDLKDAFAAIPGETRQAMPQAGSAEFMKLFRDASPHGFAAMFKFYLVADESWVEKDGKVLAAMVNERSQPVLLAMSRGADGELRLVSEAEFQVVARTLTRDLEAKLAAAQSAAAP